MNTAQTIKTMIMAVINQSNREQKEALLEALYDLTNEIDAILIDEDEYGMYDDIEDDNDLEFECEFKRI